MTAAAVMTMSMNRFMNTTITVAAAVRIKRGI